MIQGLVSVIQQFPSRYLVFRENDGIFGSIHNGRFMMSLELTVKYRPFIAGHMFKYGNPGKETTTYLSLKME